MKDLLPVVPVSPFYLISLIVLTVFFVSLLFWVCRRDRRKLYQELAKLPLAGDNENWRLE
ncbi:MAG TPA: cbb3-type cytochrome c oxidase subunit 3 [Oligoflexia bacterium]|nr:cbb3-type cytochrome c oxidase subunit 3 [Oligoflexia bacterium]